MKWTEIKSGQTNGAFQRFMVSLGEKADVVVNRINTDNFFIERLTEYATNGCVVPNTSHEVAQVIMGKNFFGIEEAIKHFGVNPTRSQIAMLSKIPYTREELMMCANTHILVAILPISISEIQEIEIIKKNELFFFKKYEYSWYYTQQFATKLSFEEIGWKLILKTPLTDSIHKDFSEQVSLVTTGRKIPTAQMMVYAIIGHFLNTKERLFENDYVRTSSVIADGRHVHVGSFKKGKGLVIQCTSNHAFDWDIGLSVLEE